MSEFQTLGLFVVKVVFPNGNTYHHGFAEQVHAKVYSDSSRIYAKSDMFYATVQSVTPKQKAESKLSRNGCALNETQLSGPLRRVA